MKKGMLEDSENNSVTHMKNREMNVKNMKADEEKKNVGKTESEGNEGVWKIVEGDNAVLGRLASIVALRALNNERIAIVNAEKVVINGTKEAVMERFYRRQELQSKGNPFKGPRFYKQPDTLIRNAVKGMLPMDSIRGKNAIKRVKVFIGIPKEFEGKEIEKINDAMQKRKKLYMRIEQISKLIGGKW